MPRPRSTQMSSEDTPFWQCVRRTVRGAFSYCVDHNSDHTFEDRCRLMNISWFMRSLIEPIPRQANKEDNCTGRLWKGRLKSQALLKEAGAMAYMTHVDLYFLRALMAVTPEQSNFAGIQRRIKAAVHGMRPARLIVAAALTVGLAFPAAPAMAQEAFLDKNKILLIVKTTAQSETITAEEAIERSNGKVLLHYGIGYDDMQLQVNLEILEDMGYQVVAFSGGPHNNTDVYFFGNKIPKTYSALESGEMLAFLRLLGEKYKVITSNEPDAR